MKITFVRAEIWPDTYIERPGEPVKSRGWKVTVEIAKEEISPAGRWYSNETQHYYTEEFARALAFVHDRHMECEEE